MLKELKKHWMVILSLAVVYLLGILTVIYKPQFSEYKPLEELFWLFGLSLNSTILLIAIGGFLICRWAKKKNTTNLIWGVSFLLYSIVFVGLMLQAHGVAWANQKLPHIFFAFRQFMILWAAGMTYGLLKIFTNNKKFQIALPALIVLAGYSWFWYGLMKVADIEYTMYGFLFGIFIPVAVFLAYLFWRFAHQNKLISLKFVAGGFLGIALTYGLWAPWHLTKVYALCFFGYELSLVPLLIGFILLPWEQKSKK